VGAVVLGGDYVGLGVARSLGRKGIPVCVIDDERSISGYSRYVSRSIRIGSMSNGKQLVAELLRLKDRNALGGWLLFPTRDETVAAIARHHEELARHFRVTSPDWETFRWAWNKQATYELAARVGVPTPKTWSPRTTADLDDIDAELPLVIKPAIKPRFLAATKKKAWLVTSKAELKSRFPEAVRIAGGDPVLVQELVPGFGDYQLAYCALYGPNGSVASMVARRVRQHPMDFGRASTYVETVELPEIRELSERVLGEIGFKGLVEVEYKRDPRTAELKLLDINARAWGYHALGAAAGVDFPYLAYRQRVLGAEPPEEMHARIGVSWMRLLTDLPTVVLEIKAGRLGALGYMRQLRTRSVEAVFNLADPAPGLAELLLIPYLARRRGF